MRPKVVRRAPRGAELPPDEPSSPVGVRELKNRLSEFLRLVTLRADGRSVSPDLPRPTGRAATVR
jgi:hypothetical protein